MYCYKPTTGSWQFYHLVEIIIDNEVKCLCGKKFNKGEIIISKSSPRAKKYQDMCECSQCENNLRKFWKNNVKVFEKVTDRLYKINGTDNLVEIKKHET